MNCPNCNHLLPPKSKFCNECGCNISTAGSALEQEHTLSDDQTIMGPGEAAHDPQTGLSPTTGHYQILEQIGQGGMGTVYRARDTKLDIEVALKRLSSEMADSEQGVRRFLNEARTIAQLNHQNIVRVITIGEDDQGHYIVMDLIDGQDLGRVIQQRGQLDLDEAMDLFRGICNGVSYAHKRGVIHRDIKPSNVLLMSDGTPKLVDFGLARIGRDSDLSMTGYGLGTMSYMSPEQKRDAKHVDHRSDIFALAKTFYHMVTGEAPDQVDPESMPASIRPMVMRALKPKPEDRYFSVDEFWEALEKGYSSPERSVVSPPQSMSDGECLSCHHINPPDIKYCQACGAGLFEICPRPDCGHEQRAGIVFCGGCGLNIPEYRQYQDHIETARIHLENHKYSRVIKEAEAGLALRDGDPELLSLLAEAEEKQSRHSAHVDELQQAMADHKLKTAAELIGKVLELVPDDHGAQESREAIEDLLDRMSGHLTEGRRFLKERDYERASKAVQAALALNSESEEARELQRELGNRLNRLASLRTDLKVAREKNQLDRVSRLADELQQLSPDDDDVMVARQEVEGLAAQISSLLEKSLEALREGDYGTADRIADEALILDAENEKCIDLKRTINTKQKIVSSYRTRLETASAENRYEEVIELCNELGQLLPRDAELIELKITANRKLKLYQSRVAEVSDHHEAHRFDRATNLCGELRSECAWDKRLRGLEAEINEDHERLLAGLKKAQDLLSRGRYSRAIKTAREILEWSPDQSQAVEVMEVAKRESSRRADMWRKRVSRTIWVTVSLLVMVSASLVAFDVKSGMARLDRLDEAIDRGQWDYARQELEWPGDRLGLLADRRQEISNKLQTRFDERIGFMIAEAESCATIGRIVEPEYNCALNWLREAESIAPHDERVLEARKLLADRLIEEGDEARKMKQFDVAVSRYEQGQLVYGQGQLSWYSGGVDNKISAARREKAAFEEEERERLARKAEEEAKPKPGVHLVKREGDGQEGKFRIVGPKGWTVDAEIELGYLTYRIFYKFGCKDFQERAGIIPVRFQGWKPAATQMGDISYNLDNGPEGVMFAGTLSYRSDHEVLGPILCPFIRPLTYRIAGTAWDERGQKVSFDVERAWNRPGIFCGAIGFTGLPSEPRHETWSCACPWIYAFNGSGYEKRVEIIANLNSKALESTQVASLGSLAVIDGRVRIQIREEKEETSFVDRVSLLINGIEVVPAPTSDHAALLENVDGEYLVMNLGDVVTVEFPVPDGMGDGSIADVQIISTGYYIPD